MENEGRSNMSDTLIEGLAERCGTFLVRRRMHFIARFLVWIHALKPRLLHYVEALETKVDNQERELRALRWALKGEQLGHWDEELDIREWRSRAGGNSHLSD